MRKLLLVIWFIVLAAIPSYATVTLVQIKRTATNDTHVHAIFASNVTANNLIIASIYHAQASNPGGTVSDSQGNTYTSVIQTNYSTDRRIETFWAIAANSAANTVTFTWASGSGTLLIEASEWSGAATSSVADVFAGASASSGTDLASGNTGNTAQANELVYGFGYLGGAATGTEGATFTLADTGNNVIAEYKNVTAIGVQAADATQGASGVWLMQVVTFKDGVAGGAKKRVVVTE